MRHSLNLSIILGGINLKHILIVDDVAVNLKTVKLILEGQYRVSFVTSGQQALAFLKKNVFDLPDLILMDIEMPVMNGIETMQKIKEEYGKETIPVIYLTAISDKRTVVECYKNGLSDYIVKPFEADKLIEKIENVFNNPDF